MCLAVNLSLGIPVDCGGVMRIIVRVRFNVEIVDTLDTLGQAYERVTSVERGLAA